MWRVRPVAPTVTDDDGDGGGNGDRVGVKLPVAIPLTPPDLLSLTEDNLDTFVRDGVLVISQAVPSDVLHRACVSVNARLGRPNGITAFFEDQSDDMTTEHVRRPPSGHPDVALPLDSALAGGPGDAQGVGRVGRDASQDPSLLAVARCTYFPPSLHTRASTHSSLKKIECANNMYVSGQVPRCSPPYCPDNWPWES
jgi:hypothetical protein